jgi:Holliday junction DNA helicase RuvA
MYAYIKGVLGHVTPLYVIVEAGGIGYKLWTPVSLFSSMPPIGHEVKLYISFIVREQLQAFYGFTTEQERDLFELLLGVAGVGPKIALSLIGHLSLKGLQQAIHQQDTAALSRVPGIGKKTAERLIIEMRDRFKLLNGADVTHSISLDAHSQKIRDAMSALVNLGYNQLIAQKALKKTLELTSEDIELPDLISTALKHV